MRLPWQVGAALAALVYPALLLFQYLAQENIALLAFIQGLKKVWPLFSFFFLAAAFLSFWQSRRTKGLYQSNQSIEKIRKLSWQQFEQFIGQHFRAQGFSVIETPEGPDGGIDLVLRKNSEKTYVQCKHWKATSIGVDKLREFFGVMVSGGADNGFYVTTGRYSAPAREFAEQHGIQLIDGSDLNSAYQQQPTEQPPETIETQATPHCPNCNSAMILRTAQKGKNKGSQFWGCSRFPACRGTINV